METDVGYGAGTRQGLVQPADSQARERHLIYQRRRQMRRQTEWNGLVGDGKRHLIEEEAGTILQSIIRMFLERCRYFLKRKDQDLTHDVWHLELGIYDHETSNTQVVA